MKSRESRPAAGGGSAVWDAHELADATGLHVTTVRFHLDVLRRAGLVVSHRQVRHTSGRPRIGFRLAARGAPENQPYRMLAGLLAEGLGDAEQARSRRAERLGRHWAATVLSAADHGADDGSTTVTPTGRTSVSDVVTQVFDDLGFAPSHEVQGGYDVFELHACPFAEVAAEHPEVVCAIHRGLLRGLVDGTGGCGLVTGVQSFVEPELCIAHISPRRLPTGAVNT